MLLSSILVPLEHCNLLAIHVLSHLVRLPLLEREAQTLVAVILIVRLVLVVFHPDEVAVHGFGVEGKRNQCIDGGCFGDDLEGPGLTDS